MSLQKQQPFRSRKLLDAAKGEPCIACGADDGTVVAAHYSGMGSHGLGKGTGTKVSDIAAAHLCHRCHTEMDSYAQGNTTERSQVFLMLILKTIVKLAENGTIKVF